MSFDNLTLRVEFAGDGTSTDFPFTFPFRLKSDIVVTLVNTDGTRDTLTLDVDYELSGEGDPEGGEVVLGTELLVGQQLVIERSVELTQDTDIDNLGESYAEVIESALDKLMQTSQQLNAYTHIPVEFDALPTAALVYRNRIISLRTDDVGPSALWVCLEQAAGVFEWHAIGEGTGGGGGLTEEEIQDLVAVLFIDSSTIDFTYDDNAPSVVADLKDTTVVAGDYTNADITVDAQGRITSAADGTPEVGSTAGILETQIFS